MVPRPQICRTFSPKISLKPRVISLKPRAGFPQTTSQFPSNHEVHLKKPRRKARTAICRSFRYMPRDVPEIARSNTSYPTARISLRPRVSFPQTTNHPHISCKIRVTGTLHGGRCLRRRCAYLPTGVPGRRILELEDGADSVIRVARRGQGRRPRQPRQGGSRPPKLCPYPYTLAVRLPLPSGLATVCYKVLRALLRSKLRGDWRPPYNRTLKQPHGTCIFRNML